MHRVLQQGGAFSGTAHGQPSSTHSLQSYQGLAVGRSCLLQLLHFQQVSLGLAMALRKLVRRMSSTFERRCCRLRTRQADTSKLPPADPASVKQRTGCIRCHHNICRLHLISAICTGQVGRAFTAACTAAEGHTAGVGQAELPWHPAPGQQIGVGTTAVWRRWHPDSRRPRK